MEDAVKIKFKPIKINTVDNIEAKIHGFQGIAFIFQKMAKFLGKYLDLQVSEIEKCIIYSAYMWQNNYNSNFGLYNDSLPQERLILADQMKKEVIRTLTPFVIEDKDKLKLKIISEKALLYYMRERTE